MPMWGRSHISAKEVLLLLIDSGNQREMSMLIFNWWKIIVSSAYLYQVVIFSQCSKIFYWIHFNRLPWKCDYVSIDFVVVTCDILRKGFSLNRQEVQKIGIFPVKLLVVPTTGMLEYFKPEEELNLGDSYDVIEGNCKPIAVNIWSAFCSEVFCEDRKDQDLCVTCNK
jgi:hypothetical protein